jgi:hypothetical protein
MSDNAMTSLLIRKKIPLTVILSFLWVYPAFPSTEFNTDELDIADRSKVDLSLFLRLIADTFQTGNGILRADAHHHISAVDRLIITIHGIKPDNLIAGVAFKLTPYCR